MKAHKRHLALVLAILIPIAARAGTNGSLEGVVTTEGNGEELPGANVVVAGTHLGGTTGADGSYRISNIPAGYYEIRFTLIGYQTLIVQDVHIKADLKTKLDAALPPAPVEIEPVVVTAERPPIQKDVTGTVYSASEKTFEMLPVTNVSEIIGLQPGTTLENNIRGGKTTEVVYLVDGLPVQDLIEGGAGSTLPQSSISEIAVQTGGFDPEYGNALSGVVNVVTKHPGDRHAISVRAEKDDLFGGEEVDHRNELDLSAGGPLLAGLSYFASFAALYTDTRWWQDASNFFSSPITKSYSGFGKIDYQTSSTLRLSGQFLWSQRQWHDYEYTWRFNLDGLPPRMEEGYRAAAIVSHTISPSLFYTASISRFQLNSDIDDGLQSEVDTTLYQWDFFLQYIVDGNRSWWGRHEQIQNLLKADLTWKIDDHHLLKVGAEYNIQEIYSNVTRYEPVLNVYGKPFVNKPLLNYSTDYQYFPRSGGAYIQDKIELSKDGMLLNLGFRYDYLDPRADRPVAERTLNEDDEYETEIVGTVPASAKHLFSPRIGFAAPFAVNGYLFINYGQYYQFPLFDYLYSGLNNVSLQRGVGVLVGNPDLKPEGTRAWEMSIKYALKNKIVLSATYFNKETTDQIDVKTFVPTNARVAGDYGFAEFVNNPFATASGIELVVSKEEGDPIGGSLSYTFMNAEGVSESAHEGLEYYQWGIPVPARPFPLSWDQRHTVKAIALIQLPWEMLLSAVWTFHSGRPYTYFPSSDGFTPDDSTLTFEPNNARMKHYQTLDSKFTKRFTFGGEQFPVILSFYVDARNIFDTQNVLWVDSSGRVGGELGDLTAWDTGRRIRLGLRLEI